MACVDDFLSIFLSLFFTIHIICTGICLIYINIIFYTKLFIVAGNTVYTNSKYCGPAIPAILISQKTGLNQDDVLKSLHEVYMADPKSLFAFIITLKKTQLVKFTAGTKPILINAGIDAVNFWVLDLTPLVVVVLQLGLMPLRRY